MLVNQPFAAQPMPWSASLDELPTEAIQTKQMYRSVSWHRIFFTGNSDINKIASFCNAFKNVYNSRGAEFENCAAYIHDDKSVRIIRSQEFRAGWYRGHTSHSQADLTICDRSSGANYLFF